MSYSAEENVVPYNSSYAFGVMGSQGKVDLCVVCVTMKGDVVKLDDLAMRTRVNTK